MLHRALHAALLIAGLLFFVAGLLMTVDVLHSANGWLDIGLIIIGINLVVLSWAIGNGRYNERIGGKF